MGIKNQKMFDHIYSLLALIKHVLASGCTWWIDLQLEAKIVTEKRGIWEI